MGDESKGWFLWVKQTIYPWVSRRIFGRHYSVGVATDYEILSIDPEKIRLRAPDSEIIMTRIPE